MTIAGPAPRGRTAGAPEAAPGRGAIAPRGERQAAGVERSSRLCGLVLLALPIIACAEDARPSPPKVMEPGHGALVASGNEFVEINSASTARLYAADAEKEDVVSHALTTAGPPPAPGGEPAVPTWDYHTSTATVGAADFVLLYKDGEVEGTVVDLSEQGGHARSVVEIHQCGRFTPFDDAGTPTDGTDDRAANCTEYTGVVERAAVDAGGNWSMSALREGAYEVVVDLPAGYEHVNKSGAAESDADLNAVPVVPESYFTRQFAELVGRRASARTKTFYIRRRNAGSDAAFVGPEIDGTAVAPPSQDRMGDRNGRCDLGGTPSWTGAAGEDHALRDPAEYRAGVAPH